MIAHLEKIGTKFLTPEAMQQLGEDNLNEFFDLLLTDPDLNDCYQTLNVVDKILAAFPAFATAERINGALELCESELAREGDYVRDYVNDYFQILRSLLKHNPYLAAANTLEAGNGAGHEHSSPA